MKRYPVLAGLVRQSNGYPAFAMSVQALPPPVRDAYVTEWQDWYNRFGRSWEKMGGIKEGKVGQYTDRYHWTAWKPGLGAVGYGGRNPTRVHYGALGQLEVPTGGWLDKIIEKGKSLTTCDPPYFVDMNRPLKGRPPGAVSLAPPGAPELIPLWVEADPTSWACKGWYHREHYVESKVPGASYGGKLPVTKFWNENTNKTIWTVGAETASDVEAIKQDYPGVYALLAPLPKDAPISEWVDDPDYPSGSREDIKKYIEDFGSEDPAVPAEVKPKWKIAGMPAWAVIGAAALVVGGIFMGRRRKKKGKGKRPAYERA
ncbi:MAG: LPXTG cell wall anchor domain-containing protein [Planctomycetota bacterium]